MEFAELGLDLSLKLNNTVRLGCEILVKLGKYLNSKELLHGKIGNVKKKGSIHDAARV